VNTDDNGFLLALLRVPAFLYGAAVELRNRFYSRSGSAVHPGVPVVSVGNLTVGGTGKTPMVAWLARQLRKEGRHPAVLSRGYRGTAGRGPLLVSDGSAAPLVGPERCGDEPFLLARSLPGTVVLVGSERRAAAVEARSLGADVLLLDDGFQHRALARDLDLVLLDSRSPFGNGRLLPAGTLREPPSSLARADMIILTRSRPGERFPEIEREIRTHNESAPILSAGHRRTGFVDADGDPAPPPSKAVAFCGIGSPDAFAVDLESEPVEVVAFQRFRDHHPFTEEDWDSLVRLALRHEAALVTTEKDLVRLPASRRSDAVTLAALRIEAVVHDETILLDRLSETVAGNPA
jgi:tetraacyldisaccharide 4'-kinase